jgi:hypothetical protein
MRRGAGSILRHARFQRLECRQISWRIGKILVQGNPAAHNRRIIAVRRDGYGQVASR